MSRTIAMLLALTLALTACADDQVVLRRGPLGPASYRVEVDARGSAAVRISRRAELRVTPRSRGAVFTMRPVGAAKATPIQADLRLLEDGSVTLDRIRGTAEDTGHTELASLAGQLSPQLPKDPVRIGEEWRSSQRITTKSLSATIGTKLHIVRFTRVGDVDAAEFEGDVSGRLRTTSAVGSYAGRLSGDTRVLWDIDDGRVISAATELEWLLETGDSVQLTTSVAAE